MKYGDLTSTEIRQVLDWLGGVEGVRTFLRDPANNKIRILPATELNKMTEIVIGVEDPAKGRKPFTVLPGAAAYFKVKRFSEATTPKQECVVWRATLRDLGLSAFDALRKQSRFGLREVQEAFRVNGLKTLNLELLTRLRATYHNQPVDEFLNVPVNNFGTIMTVGHGSGYGLFIDQGLHSLKLDSEWVFMR